MISNRFKNEITCLQETATSILGLATTRFWKFDLKLNNEGKMIRNPGFIFNALPRLPELEKA